MTSNPILQNLKPGSIVKCYNAQAGHNKWHICLLPGNISFAGQFLFINSKNPKINDLILQNKDFPCIPGNATNTSIISCSGVWPASDTQLGKFMAKIVGHILPNTKKLLQVHFAGIQTHSFDDRELRIVRAALPLL